MSALRTLLRDARHPFFLLPSLAPSSLRLQTKSSEGPLRSLPLALGWSKRGGLTDGHICTLCVVLEPIPPHICALTALPVSLLTFDNGRAMRREGSQESGERRGADGSAPHRP